MLTVLAIVLGALAAGFAASIVLAGCSGEPSTPPTTPPATSTAPSPTPTPTPTPTPDAAVPPQRPDMSTVDAATAEAVAVYFLQLYPYVYATGDLSEWRELSHPECVFCASVITNVEQMLADGHTADGGMVSVRDVTSVQVSARHFTVELVLTQSDGLEYDASGTVVDRSVGRDYLMTVSVLAEDGAWLIRGVDVEDGT